MNECALWNLALGNGVVHRRKLLERKINESPIVQRSAGKVAEHFTFFKEMENIIQKRLAFLKMIYTTINAKKTKSLRVPLSWFGLSSSTYINNLEVNGGAIWISPLTKIN